MPAKVVDPNGNQNFLKCGYLLRDDATDNEGDLKRIPFINDRNLKKDEVVIFDVVDATVEFNGKKARISMAVIPDEFFAPEWSPQFKKRWEESWDPTINKRRKMRLGNLNDAWKKHPCYGRELLAAYQSKLHLKGQQ